MYIATFLAKKKCNVTLSQLLLVTVLLATLRLLLLFRGFAESNWIAQLVYLLWLILTNSQHLVIDTGF
jgi:hypothetical protein